MPTDRDNKENSIKCRCTPEQRKLWEQAAEKDERLLSDWIRINLTKLAKSQLGDDASTGKSGKRKG